MLIVLFLADWKFVKIKKKSVPSTNCLVAYCTVKHTYHTLFYVWLQTIRRLAGLDVP